MAAAVQFRMVLVIVAGMEDGAVIGNQQIAAAAASESAIGGWPMLLTYKFDREVLDEIFGVKIKIVQTVLDETSVEKSAIHGDGLSEMIYGVAKITQFVFVYYSHSRGRVSLL